MEEVERDVLVRDGHRVLLFEAIEQSSTEMYYLGHGRNPLKVFLYFERNNGNL